MINIEKERTDEGKRIKEKIISPPKFLDLLT